MERNHRLFEPSYNNTPKRVISFHFIYFKNGTGLHCYLPESLKKPVSFRTPHSYGILAFRGLNLTFKVSRLKRGKRGKRGKLF